MKRRYVVLVLLRALPVFTLTGTAQKKNPPSADDPPDVVVSREF